MGGLLRVATAGSVDDGKSTLVGRLLLRRQGGARRPAGTPSSGRPGGAATTTPTSRCWSTGCGPSASRASPSTSPTATSPPRGARSSSPTPRGTCSTPATRSPARPPPTSRCCWSTPGTGLVEQTRRHAARRRPARRRARRARGQQDGPGRLRRGRLRRDRRRLRRPRRRAGHRRLVTAIPISRAARRQRGGAVRPAGLVRGPGAAASCWRALDRRPDPPTPRCALPGAVRRSGRAAEHPDYRGYAGRVAAGVLRPGDEVVVLPSGLTSTVVAASTPRTARWPAPRPAESVPVRLADDIDVARGDLHRRSRSAAGGDPELTATVVLAGRDAAASRAAGGGSGTPPARPGRGGPDRRPAGHRHLAPRGPADRL